MSTSTARPPLFDSHCHLDFAPFDGDRNQVIERARAVGVQGLVIPGVSPDRWAVVAEIADPARGLYAAAGIHPQVLPDLSPLAVSSGLRELGARAEAMGAVAVGECGFDRETARRGISFEEQARVLDAQLDVAEELGLPVILHVLGAHGAALAHLEGRGPLRDGGVLHSYSGPAELLPRYLRLGLFIGFAGAITRPRARRPAQAVRAVPGERLVLETDAPDQTPHGSSSSRNEPAELRRILAAVAEARGQSPEAVAGQTTDNARALFRLA